MRTVHASLLVLLVACSGGPAKTATPPTSAALAPPAPAAAVGTAEEVGPDGPAALSVPAVVVSEDPAVVAQGKAVFDAKGCGACHQFGKKLVGPDLVGLTDRRSPTWIARMIRYPEPMTKSDPTAKALFRSLMVQMTDQGVADSELAPLISYLHAAGEGDDDKGGE